MYNGTLLNENIIRGGAGPDFIIILMWMRQEILKRINNFQFEKSEQTKEMYPGKEAAGEDLAS